MQNGRVSCLDSTTPGYGNVKSLHAFNTLTCPTGTVTLNVAVDVATLPVEVAVRGAAAAANCGMCLSLKVVPTGIFVPVTSTDTGFVVPPGRVRSAVEYVPPVVEGVETPPMALMRSDGRPVKAGVLAAVTGPQVVEMLGTGFHGPVVPAQFMRKASSRIRPTAPCGLPPAPNVTSKTPVPAISGATSRMAPPLPPPEYCIYGLANESPPRANMLPFTVILVEEARRIAPPPPPPEIPEVPVLPEYPPPPDPPTRGSKLTKLLAAP